MLQRWRAIGKTVSDLTGPRFEPPASETNELLLDQLTGYTGLYVATKEVPFISYDRNCPQLQLVSGNFSRLDRIVHHAVNLMKVT